MLVGARVGVTEATLGVCWLVKVCCSPFSFPLFPFRVGPVTPGASSLKECHVVGQIGDSA